MVVPSLILHPAAPIYSRATRPLAFLPAGFGLAVAPATMTVKQRQRIARFLMTKDLLEDGYREVYLGYAQIVPVVFTCPVRRKPDKRRGFRLSDSTSTSRDDLVGYLRSFSALPAFFVRCQASHQEHR